MKITVPVQIKPYTREEFNKIVAKGEARLGAQFFYSPTVASEVVKIEEPVKEVIHDTNCRCINVCFNRELDRILANAEQALATSKVLVEPKSSIVDEEITYVG